MNAQTWLEKRLKGQKVEWRPLGDVAEIGTGNSNTKDEDKNGVYPFFIRSKKILRSNNYQFDETAIVLPGEGGIGDIFHYVVGKYSLHQRAYRIKPFYENLLPKFLYYFFTNSFKRYIKLKCVGSTSVSIRKPMLENFIIPIPPLEIQQEIVRILDTFTELTAELSAELSAELTARKKQYEYYRDKLLTFKENEVEWKALGEITQYEQPGKYIVKDTHYDNSYSIPVLTPGKSFILGYTNETEGVYKGRNNPIILFDDFTASNKWVDFDFKVKSSALKIIKQKNDKIILKYIYYWLNTLPEYKSDGDHKRLWINFFSKKKIPLPPLDKQKEIVAILDRFEALTHSISEGLPKEIALRQKQYEYYRNQLLNFPKPEQD